MPVSAMRCLNDLHISNYVLKSATKLMVRDGRDVAISWLHDAGNNAVR